MGALEPGYPLFLQGTDVGLRMITMFIFLVYMIWTVLAIALSSLPEPSLDYSGNPPIPAIPPASTLQALFSPLNTLVQNHFYEYAHDGIDTVLALFAIWSSCHAKTRQQRVVAVIAGVWTSFSWFIYARYAIQAFGANNPFCASTWNSFPSVAALNIPVSFDSAYCEVMRGTAVCSILLLLGRILLAMYAIGQFYETKGLEPYCELDKREIQRNIQHRQQAQLQPKPSLQHQFSDIVIESQPLGFAHVTVPGKERSGISSVSECSLSPASRAVMFFVWLTVAGFIITMLSFIELLRLDHQQPGVLFHALGNHLMDTVMVYPALQLFFSLTLAAVAAYDRVRENAINPLLLNFLDTIQLWGMFIYSARRLTLSNCPAGANGSNCLAYPASQRAMTAGLGIMACSEFFRLFAMVWKIISTPKAQVTNPTVAAATHASSRFGFWGYAICNSLYILIIFAYFILMLIQQSMTGLFQVSPQVGFAAPFGQNSVEDILEYPYHNFAISILIMGWMIGSNMYVDVGGTRSAALTVFVTQMIQCGSWLAMCFPPAYAMMTTAGYYHHIWCVDSFTSIYGNDACNYTTAAGRLSILFFSVMVLNTIINGGRLLATDIGARSALPAATVQDQGTRAALAEAKSTGRVGFADTWWIGEFGLWITIFGWMIFCLAAANEGQKAFFVGEQEDSTFGFDVFQYISAHYVALAILLGPGLTTAHLLSNREFRQHSYGWRLGHIVTFILHASFLVVMIVILGRYVHNLNLNSSQLAMFSGLVILLAGDVFSFVAFRAYFWSRPVVRLAATAEHGHEGVIKPAVNGAHHDLLYENVDKPTVSTGDTGLGSESNSAHQTPPSHFQTKPGSDHEAGAPAVIEMDHATHWHIDEE